MIDAKKIAIDCKATAAYTLSDLFPEQSSTREHIALAQLFKSAAIHRQDWEQAACCRDVEKTLKDQESDNDEQFRRRLQKATDEIIAAASQAVNEKVAAMNFKIVVPSNDD